ncbi:hypothetical protein [Neisseria montereyensis]|uniref:Uncharacterized protein n=1 Tax=Neisseria montereyensis TaxID=2973938 RepID=A0ABT2FDI4_9NEIS|nr:hypothetical protein [Neisseria montereyensis]MCS4534274.1 hypothetical protein [Neisseria montereyensis]
MNLVENLIKAAEDPETPAALRLLLSHASARIVNLEKQELYDSFRLDWLEDLGSFGISKQDGQNPLMTVEIDTDAVCTASAPTVCETIDLAREEYLANRGV